MLALTLVDCVNTLIMGITLLNWGKLNTVQRFCVNDVHHSNSIYVFIAVICPQERRHYCFYACVKQLQLGFCSTSKKWRKIIRHTYDGILQRGNSILSIKGNTRLTKVKRTEKNQPHLPEILPWARPAQFSCANKNSIHWLRIVTFNWRNDLSPLFLLTYCKAICYEILLCASLTPLALHIVKGIAFNCFLSCLSWTIASGRGHLGCCWYLFEVNARLPVKSHTGRWPLNLDVC